jgi:hypothetical protein
VSVVWVEVLLTFGFVSVAGEPSREWFIRGPARWPQSHLVAGSPLRGALGESLSLFFAAPPASLFINCTSRPLDRHYLSIARILCIHTFLGTTAAEVDFALTINCVRALPFKRRAVSECSVLNFFWCLLAGMRLRSRVCKCQTRQSDFFTLDNATLSEH